MTAPLAARVIVNVFPDFDVAVTEYVSSVTVGAATSIPLIVPSMAARFVRFAPVYLPPLSTA